MGDQATQILNLRLPLDITFSQIPDSSGASTVESNCNAIAFENTGTQMAYINGYPFPPAKVIEYGGEVGVLIKTFFNITFSGTGTGKVWVTKGTYL